MLLLGILLSVLIIVCLALGGVVLLQRSEGGALGMGGGPSGFLTTRGAGDLLTRTTWILGGVLFALCLALTILQGRLHKGASVVDRLKIDPLSADALVTPRAAPAAAPAASPAGNVTTGFETPAPPPNVAPAFTPPAAPPPRAVAPRAEHHPAAAAPVAAAPKAVAPVAAPSPAPGAASAAPAGNTTGG